MYIYIYSPERESIFFSFSPISYSRLITLMRTSRQASRPEEEEEEEEEESYSFVDIGD
jgi:hypothetical protein